MRKILIFIFCLFRAFSFGQAFDAFSQSIDISVYRGGQFRFRGFVKAENGTRISQARLLARVAKKKGYSFLDNMYKRPILSNEWKEYLIEGPIDKSAVQIVIGGMFFGNSKYYYDQFSLEAKTENGDWEKLMVKNDNFENEPISADWELMHQTKGFKLSLTTADAYEGQKSLLVDGSSLPSLGKFIEANGINIYFEECGKGDTLLLLHGNSQSVKAFKKQIPELSKYFHVVAMDSRGQGFSSEDGTPLTYELMAEDVNSFLKKLNFKKINILGWSDGGNIGLILAIKYPDKVKKLAIMGSNLYNDQTSVGEKFNKRLRNDKSELIKTDNKFQIRLIDLMLNEPKIKPDDLKNIKCPALVMAGSNDIIKDGHTRLIASKIEKSKLVIFENGTHFEPELNPERFNKTVLQFFKEK